VGFEPNQCSAALLTFKEQTVYDNASTVAIIDIVTKGEEF
jgi:hypothetical protein